MEKLVSIIIPTLKGDKSIARAIASVQNQTYQNFEIIVVLDMPFDTETEEVLKAINDKRISIYKVDKKVSASYARNIGISKAKGEYIAFLDDDDEWTNLKLRNQIDFLDNNPNFGGVLCDFIFATDGNYTYHQTKSNDYAKDILLMNVKVAAGSNLLTYTKYAKEIGGFDVEYEGNQDLEFLIRLNDTYKVGHINGYLLKVNGRGGRVATNTDKLLRVKKLLFKNLKNIIEKYPKKIQDRIYARNWLQIARGYSIEGDNELTKEYLKLSYSHAILFSNTLKIIPAESYFLIAFNYVKNLIFRKN